MTPLKPAVVPLPKPREFIAKCKAMGIPRSTAKAEYKKLKAQKVYINDLYQVHVDDQFENQPFPDINIVHLSIKNRVDRGPASRDWRDLQAIKNELFSREHEAMEIFPAESRLVDVANQTHLWVFTRAEDGGPVNLMVGFHSGRKVDYESKHGAVQRPRPAPGTELSRDGQLKEVT